MSVAWQVVFRVQRIDIPFSAMRTFIDQFLVHSRLSAISIKPQPDWQVSESRFCYLSLFMNESRTRCHSAASISACLLSD